MTNTPHLQVAICKLPPISMFSITNFMVFLCHKCDCVARRPSPPSTLFMHPLAVGDELQEARSIDLLHDEL